jgi:hypothetical protein
MGFIQLPVTVLFTNKSHLLGGKWWRNFKMKYFVLLFVVLLVGCSDAGFKQLSTIGAAGSIVCYSGGKVIYDGISTGKIATENQSDGWFFEDAKTHKLVRVSGDCLIQN